MLFNQTAEYALRAMAHLAMLPPGTSARARDLSAATGIPSDYVSKVLRRMVRSDLLLSQKGHGGGFKLARPPEEITFAEILHSVDEPLDQERCAFGWGACGSHAPCPLHDAYSTLKQGVWKWAQETTLADEGQGRASLPTLPASAEAGAAAPTPSESTGA